jgi:hypothetical protein
MTFKATKKTFVVSAISTFSHNTDMKYMPTNCMIPVASNLSAIKKCVIDFGKMHSDMIIVCCYPHLKKFFEFHIGKYIISNNSNTFFRKYTKIPIMYVSPTFEDMANGISATEACLKSFVYFYSGFKNFREELFDFSFQVHYWDCIMNIKQFDFQYLTKINLRTKLASHYDENKFIRICHNGKSFLDGYNYPFVIDYETVEKALKNIDNLKQLVKIKKHKSRRSIMIYNSKYFSNKKIFSFLDEKVFFDIKINNVYQINTNRKYKKYMTEVFK